MTIKYTQPQMWKHPPKEPWIKDAVAAGKAKQEKEHEAVPKPIKPSDSAFAQRQTNLEVALELELKTSQAIPDANHVGRGDASTGATAYTIDWTVDSQNCPCELPSNLKSLASIVPPIKNGFPPASQSLRKHRPAPVQVSAWPGGANSSDNGDLELFEPPLTTKVVSIQNLALQPIHARRTAREQASKTWSLEVQEPEKQQAREKPQSAPSKPVKPTTSDFAQGQTNFEVTTLELEPDVESTVSTAPANIEMSLIKLAEQQITKLEESNRELEKERDNAVKLAQANGNRLERLRRNSRKPMASILVMAKLLKELGLSAQQRTVAERILNSASALSIDLFEMHLESMTD